MDRKTIKQQVQEHGKQIAETLRKMPNCSACGCPRIKHGVYCNQECITASCFCEAYRLPKQDPPAYVVGQWSE